MVKIKGFDAIKPKKIYIVSEADYSLEVLLGKRRYDGSRMPARPWLTVALAEFDLLYEIKQHYTTIPNIGGAFVKAGESFLEYEKELIKAPIWKWDRVTFRSSGAIASSPRDIVDTGNLYRSQKIIVIK